MNLLSEDRVRRTLGMMRQPLTARLTHDISMGICQRTNGTLLVEGSVERVDGLYVLGLRALTCDSESLVDPEQAKAETKESVLEALSQMASSATTLRRQNVSLAEATTSSVEALQAYTSGWMIHTARGAAEAIPLLRHAVELDGEFAMAHAALGRMYADVDESDLSSQSLRRAWDLKDHASDREQFLLQRTI